MDGLKLEDSQRVLLDSYIIPNFVQNVLKQDPAELYKTLWKNAPWNDPSAADFRLRGHELKRQKAYLISSNDPEPCLDQEPSILLFYRFPGAQYGSLKAYRDLRNVPELNNIVADFNKNLLFDDQGRVR